MDAWVEAWDYTIRPSWWASPAFLRQHVSQFFPPCMPRAAGGKNIDRSQVRLSCPCKGLSRSRSGGSRSQQVSPPLSLHVDPSSPPLGGSPRHYVSRSCQRSRGVHGARAGGRGRREGARHQSQNQPGFPSGMIRRYTDSRACITPTQASPSSHQLWSSFSYA